MVIRRNDSPLSLDVQGTAFDVLPETDFLAVAGRNTLSVVKIGISAHSSASSLVQLRHNRNLVRLLKFNPIGTGRFATVSGPFVDVYTLGQGSTVRRLASLQAQSRKVSDFCWCPFDDQLMSDSVSFWDLRSDFCRPSAQLGLLFGAGQAKFAPHLNNLVLSATGSDLRLWDLRHTSQPIVQFKGHQSRVLCLDWHPHHQEPNTFFTSANDGALKLWSFGEQRSEPIVFNVAPISAWRLVFSQEGQELAALSLSPPHSVALFFNYGLENLRQLKGIERGDILMDAAWHKSTSALKSTTKFLYTLSKKRRLCRHAIAYELSNEIRDEMSTPIMQSAVDEERDRMIAAAASAVEERTETLPSVNLEERSRKEFELPAPTRPFPRHLVGSGQSSGKTALGFGTTNLKSLISSLKAEGGRSAGGTDGGHKTPQSPIYSDWHRWIKAPNVLGGDLLTELEALRKHSTEGLYTTEVNFQRAAIAFSYMHQNRFRKICWEMRFHREFIENGLVFVEVIQNESPLTPEKASLFLTLLQQECDEQLRVPSTQTVLCRVFHQLPKLISLMKLFPLPIDVPSAVDLSLSKASSQSGSAGEDPEFVAANQQQQQPSATVELNIPAKKQSLVSAAAGPVIFPVTFVPSPFDHRVPAPRNCGARFNASGYLVTFGKAKSATAPTTIAKLMNQQQNKPKQQPQKTENPAKNCGRQNARKTPANATKMSTSVGADESVKKVGTHPRSLAEYCVLVNSPLTFSPAALFRQCSSMASSTSAIPFAPTQFQGSPPVRCLSPLRPTSPWARPVDAGGEPSADAEQSQEAVSSGDRADGREPISLSPPSLMKQLLSGTGRIMGSSPNSSTSLTAINPRTFSLHFHQQQQSPAFQAMMRQRVTTMSAVAEGALAPANSHPLPIQHQMSAMVELCAGKSLAGWPMAVMPEQQSFTSTVLVYDTVSLLPISQELARSYKLLGSSPLAICRHNREQAARKGRRDLLTVWQLLEQCVCNGNGTAKKYDEDSFVNGSPTKHSMDVFSRAFGLRSDVTAKTLISSAKRADAPWSIHPFGRSLINRILAHYVSRHDLQTAAVITCVLDGLNSDGRKVTKERRMSDKKESAAILRRLERQKFVGEMPKKAADALLTAGPTKEMQTEQQVEGLFFAMDQADSSSSVGKVPPAPPAPPLLPSQQLQLPPSRKTSAAQGGVGTSLASVMPSLSFVGGPCAFDCVDLC
ncbi:hypothetical protein niasHS_003426 [Heterodera schachtii]|uniref:WD_REPEATS_REGION domain-containing protein n=1 Tax=Heterodera schachtii TaxID=97005 RepID=A0ABD2KGG8_HETSC